MISLLLNIVLMLGTIVLVAFVINEGIHLWREINNKSKDEW